MKSLSTLLTIVLLAFSSCNNTPTNKVEGKDSEKVAEGTGISFVVDNQASTIAWKGAKPGGFHNGTINLKNGEVTVNGVQASGNFVIDMKGIVCSDITDAKMNKKLVEHLESTDFFDVEQYSEASFAITKTDELPANDTATHLISGNLKIKDVEKNISFAAKVTKDNNSYKAVSIPFSIDRTQWNVKYGSKSVFADLKDKFIDDNIELQITIVAKAKQ